MSPLGHPWVPWGPKSDAMDRAEFREPANKLHFGIYGVQNAGEQTGIREAESPRRPPGRNSVQNPGPDIPDGGNGDPFGGKKVWLWVTWFQAQPAHLDPGVHWVPGVLAGP